VIAETQKSPFWETSNFAPVSEEVTTADLVVEGSIPPELSGLYVRNGANPRSGRPGHWFLGDGMLHGVSLAGGKAHWYRNRWVRTPKFENEGQPPASPLDLRNSAANTSVVQHAGRILALVENALPFEVDRRLEKIGFHDFGGKLTTSFTAHPKICPETGEMHFFGYSVMPPYVTYHVADKTGALTRSLEVPTAGPTMVHDFAITRNHIIFLDLPIVFDLEMALRGTMPFVWSDTYGARLGVLPRGAGLENLRWVEVEPGYVYHVGNAYEKADGSIVLDVAWYQEHWRGGASNKAFEPARLKRWTIAPDRSRVAESLLDDRPIEFPKINDGHCGLAHQFVYAVETGGETGTGRHQALTKFDVNSGETASHVFHDAMISEFVHIAPPSASREDDGWLMGYVFDRTRGASDLIILDAATIAKPPIARIKLPCRVPQGFHGNWMPNLN